MNRPFTNSPASQNKSKQLIIISVCSIAFGYLLVFLFRSLAPTWATLIIFALLVPLMLFISRNSHYFTISALAILLPITVSKTLANTGHLTSGASGYVVSAFDIFLTLMYIFWIAELVQRKKRVQFFPKISIPALLLIGIASISMSIARYPVFSKFELIEVIKMYLCFIYLANNIKSKKEIDLIVLVLLLTLIFEGIIGFLQHHYGEPFFPSSLGGPPRINGSRISGTWCNFNDFAWYLTFVLPLALSMLFSPISQVKKLIYFLAFVLGSAALIWTDTRAGWISMAVVSVLVLLFVFAKMKGKSEIIRPFLTTMLVLILIAPIYPRLTNKIAGRMLGNDAGSAESRLPQYEVAYNIILHNPILGIGLNNYTEVMLDYDITENGLLECTPFAVHNIFLLNTAEMGVVGFIIFIWFIAVIMYTGIKYCISVHKQRNTMVYTVFGLLAGIIGFLIHGLVDVASLGNKIYMFVWFFAGLIVAANKKEFDESQ